MKVYDNMILLWFLRVREKYKLQQTFSVDPVYLRHENSQAATDFMVWHHVLTKVNSQLTLWIILFQ